MVAEILLTKIPLHIIEDMESKTEEEKKKLDSFNFYHFLMIVSFNNYGLTLKKEFSVHKNNKESFKYLEDLNKVGDNKNLFINKIIGGSLLRKKNMNLDLAFNIDNNGVIQQLYIFNIKDMGKIVEQSNKENTDEENQQ